MENFEQSQADELNQRLIDTYGIDTASTQPIWRIVRGDLQYEKRYDEFEDYTPSGLFIRRVKELRTVPKYQHIPKGAWVLEELCGVPLENRLELGGVSTSYEVRFVYAHFRTNKLLPPLWSVTRITIEALLLARGKQNPFAKYKDMSVEEKEVEFKEMYDYLYGDETATTDALAYKEGVVVPNKQFGDE